MKIAEKDRPRELVKAFELAFQEIPYNVTSYRLERDERMLMSVMSEIRKLGQRRLVNLAHSYDESRISLAFYAGNGTVVKVIPDDYFGDPGVIMHLPAISTHPVPEDSSHAFNSYSFTVKTYPWVDPGKVTQPEIETMRARLAKLGMVFEDGDDQARNIHRLPDSLGTLVGIDASMYHHKGKRSIPDHLVSAWHRAIHRLYPVYEAKAIPPQTEETSFRFTSLHNPSAVNAFEDMFGDEDSGKPSTALG